MGLPRVQEMGKIGARATPPCSGSGKKQMDTACVHTSFGNCRRPSRSFYRRFFSSENARSKCSRAVSRAAGSSPHALNDPPSAFCGPWRAGRTLAPKGRREEEGSVDATAASDSRRCARGTSLS